MEEFDGTIEIAGCAYRVSGVIEVREKNGSTRWSGFFVPPKGSDFAEQADGPYKLKLDDSRSGNVVLSGTDVDGSGTTVVDFLGSGPLE